MIGWILLAIEIIALLAGLVSFIIWQFGENENAKDVFILCLLISLGIPAILIIVFIFTVLSLFTDWINNLLGI